QSMNEFMRALLLLPPQRSTVATELDILHYVVISTTMVGAFGIALVSAVFLIRYRGRPAVPRHRQTPPTWNMPLPLELSLIVLLFSMFVGWWVVGLRQYTRMVSPPADAMVVYVVAKQWMWKFSHANGAGSVGELHVPVNTPVKL